jgi:methyl-accepting chemotaxis protein
MAKSLNARVEQAVDSVHEAREALDGACLQNEELKESVQRLSKAASKLRDLLENVGELFDDLESALSTIDDALDSLQELKLDAHVDALAETADTLEEVNALDLEV